jgi:chromosome partitioning protein
VMPWRPLGFHATCSRCIRQPAGMVGLHLLDSCPADRRPMSYALGKLNALCINGETIMPVVVSLISRKGGVAKSTTALNLAGAALNDGSSNVLLIDMDSQSSLSKALLGPEVVRQLRPDQTVQAVAERSKAAGDVVRETNVPGLLLLPSYPDLQVPADAVLNLAGIDPSLVVIDTPPDIRDSAIRCALLSSHAAISPIVPEPWGLQSVPEVQTLLMGTGVISNERLMFTGFLLSMVQRAGIHVVCENTLRRLHGSMVYDAVVPHAVAFKEATAAGQPVTHYAPKSSAAKVARTVYGELCSRIETALQRGAA